MNKIKKLYQEIEADFEHAIEGIFKFPEAPFGVYTAYKYYSKLLINLKKLPLYNSIARIRVPNYQKMGVFAQSYLNYHLNLFIRMEDFSLD